MLPGHHPEHVEAATAARNKLLPEHSDHPVVRVVKSDRASGSWFFIMCNCGVQLCVPAAAEKPRNGKKLKK